LDSTLADLGVDDSPKLTPGTLSDVRGPSHVELWRLSAAELRVVLRHLPKPAASWPERGGATPGAKFHYSNWDFNVLGDIYQRVTGTALFVAVDHRNRISGKWNGQQNRSGKLG
jgi:hypothetical protein